LVIKDIDTTMKIEYYYSVVSPFAYLGINKFRELIKKYSLEVIEKPFDLVGKVFPETGGTPVPKRHPARQKYRLIELERWAKKLNINLNKQPKFFPPSDPHKAALLTIAAIKAGISIDFGKEVLTKVWSDEQDISQDPVLEDVCKKLKLNFKELQTTANSEEVRNIYSSNSNDAINKGVFGAPSFVLNNELFWGQDRLDFLEDKLKSN
jgi:2-hydroxychromene-2-carboxylate isomerase